jgi:hypothetical protein
LVPPVGPANDILNNVRDFVSLRAAIDVGQVINLAKAGERDPERLCEAMMKEFRAPPQA